MTWLIVIYIYVDVCHVWSHRHCKDIPSEVFDNVRPVVPKCFAPLESVPVVVCPLYVRPVLMYV